MRPLTVTAELASPAVVTGPLMLDAMLYAGLGEELGAANPGGWADVSDVDACPLPLARIDAGEHWWWACSQVTPRGPEAMHHVHRRAPDEAYMRWTTDASFNRASGPDKALRLPVYRRIAMMEMVWLCVGDAQRVSELLAHIGAVGKMRTHGHGWVRRWRVEDGGPPLEDYATDVGLRHLPADVGADIGAYRRVTRRLMPLRAPYHYRALAVPCLQVADA